MTTRPSQLIENAQALGRLEGGMESVQSSIAALANAIDRDRADAHNQREASLKRLSTLEGMVVSIREDMDVVKPLAEKWRRWQYVGFGIVMTVGAAGAMIGAGLQFFHDQVLTILGLGE